MAGHGIITAWMTMLCGRNHLFCTGSGRRDNAPPNAMSALAEPKATFSFAMTVMHKVEGWNEEEWVGSTFCEGCDIVQSDNAPQAGVAQGIFHG